MRGAAARQRRLPVRVAGRLLETEPARCPSPCAATCPAPCHELHQRQAERAHDPVACHLATSALAGEAR